MKSQRIIASLLFLIGLAMLAVNLFNIPNLPSIKWPFQTSVFEDTCKDSEPACSHLPRSCPSEVTDKTPITSFGFPFNNIEPNFCNVDLKDTEVTITNLALSVLVMLTGLWFWKQSKPVKSKTTPQGRS